MERISKILLVAVFATAIAGLVFVACANDDSSADNIVFEDGYFKYDTRGSDETVVLVGYSGESQSTITISDMATNKTTGVSYTVSAIGNDVFADKTIIKTVSFGATITAIEDRAFSGCTGLESITMGTGLQSIGAYAFDGCSKLTTFETPSSVYEFGICCFRGCTSLVNFVFPDNNRFNVIPMGCFSGCTRMSSVDIPDTILQINSEAFAKCSCLKTVNISNNTGLTLIGDNAFEMCPLLSTFPFKNSMYTIGANAFKYCTSLNDITFPTRLKTIGNLAFYGCSSLTKITIPSSVETIGYGAFAMCKSLANIKVDSGNAKYATQETVLVDNSSKTIVQCPCNKETYSIPSSYTTIGAYAFCGCDVLKEIMIPSTVTYIGEYAFSYCNSVETFSISSNVTYIGENAFFVCDSLKSIDVDAENSKYLSSQGILFTSKYEELIKCPDTFSGRCTISSQVKTIDETAFFNCKNITEFYVDTSNTNYISDASGAVYSHDYSQLVAYPCASALETYEINSNVSGITVYAFSSCSHLKNLKLSSSNKIYRTSDGVLYSYDQKELIYYPSGRTDSSFSVISGVTKIDAYAFCSCPSLKNVSVVESIIDYAPESFSIGSFGQKAEVTISGPTGYVFTDYAFNKYTDVPHQEESKPFISTEVLLIIGIIIVLVIIVAVYFKRRYSY